MPPRSAGDWLGLAVMAGYTAAVLLLVLFFLSYPN
jgi:hypothetical protein